MSVKSLGRNDFCHCGSGKKYKKCCEAQDRQQHHRDSQVMSGNKLRFQQALTLHSKGKFAEAEALYQQILLTQPKEAEVLHMLGVISAQTQQYLSAIDYIQQAIQLVKIPNAAMYNNLANAFREQRQFDTAINYYQQALAIKPDYAEALNNLGVVHKDRGQHNKSINYYQQALKIQPNYAEAHYNLGVVFQEQEKYSIAIDSYQKAIQLRPNYIEAYCNMAIVLKEQRQLDQAILYFQKTLSLDPNYITAIGGLFYIQQERCDWQNYEITAAKIIQAIHNGERGRPFSFLSISDSPQAQQQCARTVIDQRHKDQKPLWTGQIYRHTKIRLAYISADFRDHPVSYLMVGLFEQHSREQFEIIGISLRPLRDNEIGKRLHKAFDQLIDVSDKTEWEIAQFIFNLEIDIAIDLMGFTTHSKMTIFAYRPAPIQVNYLGYAGTSGANYIDYIIADKTIIPPSAQPYYNEKVIYLPDTYFINDSQREIDRFIPSRTELGLPESAFVFCCFNNSYKINPTVFAIWMRLLVQLPNSVLWLPENNSHALANLRQQVIQYGIDPKRVIFAKKTPTVAQHLARLKQADLFLDTLPYNAHTTTADALWAGLPVITCMGNAFAGRVAASLLNAIGLAQLITHNWQQYEALAIQLATHPQLLNSIRQQLADNRQSYPLFNTIRFTRHLESAYLTIWLKYQQRQLPESFSVSPIAFS